MSATGIAAAHQAQQTALAAATAAATAGLWQHVDPAAVAASWTQQLPAAVAVVSGAQQFAAAAADPYLDELADEYDLDDAAELELDPRAFAGVASDGRALASLLFQPAIATLTALRGGMLSARAMTAGLLTLDMIVRTQVADAGRVADGVALTARPRVGGYVRVLSPPSCSRCAILAGRWYRWNQGFARHPRCLPAGVVVSGPPVLAATRRWYQGELVVITTAGGQELPVTGNHPVLTDRGWLPANLLQEGDHVIRSGRGQGATPLVVPHEHQVPSRIEDLWRPNSVVSLLRVPTAAEDFHGDGSHGQVDVVLADRLLRHRSVTALRQLAEEEQLAGGVAQAALLAQDGPAEQLLLGLACASYGAVCGGGLGEPFLGGHASGAYLAGRGRAAHLDAGVEEAAADGRAADAVAAAEAVLALAGLVRRHQVVDGQDEAAARWDPPAGPMTVQSRGGYAQLGQDLLLRLAGQVERDRVVDLRRIEWSGHVYNLTSAEGWYAANGLIVSNCDCRHLPSAEAEGRSLVTSPRRYFESLSEAEQRRVFTVAGARAIRDGADLSQVVNARRGMYTASVGGRRVAATVESTTRRGLVRGLRLMPEQIYAEAGGDRAEAIRLLRRHGYLSGPTAAARLLVRRQLALAADQAADLHGMTVVRLRGLAKERGVKIPSGARKADIVRLLGGGAAGELEQMTVAQLRKLAGERGVKVLSRDRKADLVAKLRASGASGRAGTALGDPNKMTVAQLRKLAADNGLRVPSGLRKADVIAHIRFWERGSARRRILVPEAALKAPALKAVPPTVAPPAAPRPGLPSELTGSGRDWKTLLREDTGMVPVPVRDLEVPGAGGYILKSGQAYRIDGVVYLVEDEATSAREFMRALTAQRIVEEFRAVHDSLPGASRYQSGYAWLAGRNPADRYWAERYNRPDFVSAATAGDGGVRMWNRRGDVLGPLASRDSLMHEFGHNVSSVAAHLDLHDHSRAWTSAADSDAVARRPTDIGYTGDLMYRARRIDWQYRAGKGYPLGVTEYGKSSVMEDYAESMAFYLAGEIGQGRIKRGGPRLPVYFRDLFPARAAVLDRLFPEIARRQRAAIAAR